MYLNFFKLKNYQFENIFIILKFMTLDLKDNYFLKKV
jgi:hypothetical protein